MSSTLDVKVEPDGWVKCPRCGYRFKITDRERWSGVRHRRCGQKLKLVGVENQVEPLWCLIGNIVGSNAAGEVVAGTKHFSPGTKVYCFPPAWGDGYREIRVLGRHRGSKKVADMVLSATKVENWRVKLVYAPYLVDRLSERWTGEEVSRALAEELCAMMLKRD